MKHETFNEPIIISKESKHSFILAHLPSTSDIKCEQYDQL